MDEEWEEEETTIVVELNGLTDTEFLKKNHVTCKVLGIDSEKPLLQLGTNIFSGEYKDVIGTHLILNKETGDHSESSIKSVDFHSKTQKTLVMHRTFLNEKTDGTSDTTTLSKSNVKKAAPQNESQRGIEGDS